MIRETGYDVKVYGSAIDRPISARDLLNFREKTHAMVCVFEKYCNTINFLMGNYNFQGT